jgi:hypothetical protein
MKKLYILLLLLPVFKLHSQLANGYIKISAMHKADFIQNTKDVDYKYSYTNGFFVALQLPILNKETRAVISSFEVGAGYAQFVKNASSYVMQSDVPGTINTTAPKQKFNFNYNANFAFYAQFNKHIKNRLSCQFGAMHIVGLLTNSNVFSKPTYSGMQYPAGMTPSSTVSSSGYYYSSKISFSTAYAGISYYLYKNISVSVDVALNYRRNTTTQKNEPNVSTYPVNNYGFNGIDQSLPQTVFLSGMLKLTYCFLPKK